MTKLKPILLIVLVFAAGFAAGVVTTRIVVRRFVRNALVHPDLVRNRVEIELDRRLRLNPEQRAEVGRILVRTQTRIRALRQQFQPELADILRDAGDDISALLTPEQQRRFERFRAEREQLFLPR